jgi:pimeloyl-ACP methyl ester carboxylesterase
MGAAAVAAAAAKAPELVAKIVLVGPFVRDIPVSRGQAAMLWLMTRLGLVGPWGPAAWLAFYDSLYPGRKPADHGAYRTLLKDSLKQPGRMAAARAMMLASKADVAALLPSVRAATLVVMGSRDPDFPDPEAEARIVAGLLRGEVAMIPGAGHYPHAEMPEDMARAVLPFIAREGTR